MAMVRCNNGHFYDSSMGACPICAQQSQGYGGAPVDDIPETSPVSGWDNMGQAAPAGNFGGFTVGATQPVTNPGFSEGDFVNQPSSVDDYGATEASPINGVEGFDPVVGWLICVKGPNRGRDYKLHSGANFIGRAKEMDVCIENDQTISKRNAASISYDDRTRTFFIEKGEVRNLLYLNGQPVRSNADVVMYDRIEVGSTELIFVPLCGAEFNWQDM